MARKIVLDCDPGHDDAVAMLLAHGSPEIEVRQCATVCAGPWPVRQPV
jgi:purine nucleosidase